MTQPPSRSRLQIGLRVLAIGLAVGVLAAVACSGRDELPHAGGVGGNSAGRFEAGPCEEGTKRECGVTVAKQGNALTCYNGTQACEGGAWGACTDGHLTEERWQPPPSGGSRTQALGPPADCVNNPCDPFCKQFDEQPDGALAADVGPTPFDWDTGSVTGLPPAIANKGLNEPCESAADCQFNHSCQNVATSSACLHSKCVAGAALDAACDPCVGAICAQDPSCCEGTTCAHDPCVPGPKLDATCSSCAAAVCAAQPSCCQTSWDASCVALVNATCSNVTCGCGPGELTFQGHCYNVQTNASSWSEGRTACGWNGAGWDLVSISSQAEQDFVHANSTSEVWIGFNDLAVEGNWAWAGGDAVSYTHWAPGEPNGGTGSNCARMYYEVGNSMHGFWRDIGCSSQYRSFCEGPLRSSGSQWSQSCIDQVKTVCDATCGSGSPPAEDGTCSPWIPGQTDTACNGVDLAVGVPCQGGNVPVCNHGTQPAPAGVEVFHFPAGAAPFATCNPDTTAATGSCTTTAAIPPGDCVNIDCPTLADTDEIVVNPAGTVAECSCLDNWSIYSASMSCGQPSCSGNVSKASFQKANLYFIFDRSGSMAGERWNGSVTALTSFFQNPATAGVGIALEFFSLQASVTVNGVSTGDGCGRYNIPDCAPATCANPMVALGTVTTAAAPADTQEDLLIRALGVGTGAGTPSYPALVGALNWAVARQASVPAETHHVVFVTDGDPTECLQGSQVGTTIAMGNQAESAYLNSGVRTYVIGMEGANVSALSSIANKGGTGSAFVVSGGNPAQVAADLSAALRSITGQNASCTLTLPNAGLFNPANVTVTYTPGAGASSNLTRFQAATGCGDGWFYDDNANPSSVTLCPTTCATVQSDANAHIEVVLGCPQPFVSTSFTQIYDGQCGPGSSPQWGFLTYDTQTPGDSSVSFSARTAGTQAGLGSEAWVPLASVPTDPALCLLSGPSPPCPIDVYTKLGVVSAKLKYLELQIQTIPTSDQKQTPSVNDWQITYSCQPSQ